MAGYVSSFPPEADSAEIAESLVHDGGVIISELMPGDTMDAIRCEVENAVSAEEQEGSSELWPEGNKTVGGLAAVSTGDTARVFASPGPMFEPEARRPDYWRMARALFAAGFRHGELIHQ